MDTTNFSSDMKANYEIMRIKCVKCHSLERIIVALQTGIAPISGQPFDKTFTKTYETKMLRKSNSDMNTQEIKAIINLVNYLQDKTIK